MAIVKAKAAMNRKWGWKPSKPDLRDHKYKALMPTASLPPYVDLRPKMPPIFDQGELGSCTANAVGGACWYCEYLTPGSIIMPSRLFIYFNSRVLEGTWQEDSGCEIRDVPKAINKWGYCPEELWPYNISKFAVPPTSPAYGAAWHYRITDYAGVPQNENAIKSVLAQGLPVVIGFTVYDSFESQQVADTGIVPMPNVNAEQVLGGHAVMVVGYDDSKQTWIMRNSWGTGWGMAGYFTFPYAYLLDSNLSSDFWVISKVP